MRTDVASGDSVIGDKVPGLDSCSPTRRPRPGSTSVGDGDPRVGAAFRAVHPDGASVATDMPIALGGAERAPSPSWL